jgi:hypothetical protein
VLDTMATFCVRTIPTCQLAVLFAKLRSMEAEIDCKMSSNSS